MSGMVGLFDERCSINEGEAVLERMVRLLYHQPFYNNDVLFEQDGIFSSRAHKNITQPEPQPYTHDHINVWLDGEIYNRKFFGTQLEKASDPEFLCFLYRNERDFSFLKDIDGIFSAVIHDPKRQKIRFITDRYGFKLLYYFQNEGRLAWFAEAKAALALNHFKPKIDPDAVHDFFTKGYLTDQKSWFQRVELFPPGTVMSWDISQKQFLEPFSYWSWDEIEFDNRTNNEMEIVKETGRLFKKAVKKRVHPMNRVGVTLSGGLDSRAILAAIPASDQPIDTFTFGKPGCWDIEIAREVSRIKGARHHVVNLTAKNWLDKRTAGVWWTDGQMNLMHMHVLALLPMFSRSFKLSLNGFLGAAILGGYYLQNDGSTQDKLRDRGRRFVNEGSRLGEVFGVFYRRPFVDKSFVDYVLSVPPHIRANSHLYNQMVLHEFPEYFQSVPWQRTGFAVRPSKMISTAQRKIHALRNRAVKLLDYLGISYTDHKHYHNYSVWLRKESDFVSKILHNTKALYPELIDVEQVRAEWEAHMNGKDVSENICAYLTFEIFLQQVFEGRYRPEVQNYV